MILILFFQAYAWLCTYKDPIYGSDKSRDTFWGQISNEFNRNDIQGTSFERDINQLMKIHSGRLNKSMTECNGFFSSVTKIHTSGYPDAMLIDGAQQMYKKKYGKLFPFASLMTREAKEGRDKAALTGKKLFGNQQKAT